MWRERKNSYMKTNQKLIDHACTKFKNVTAIADIYTMQFVWATKYFAEGLKYTEEELGNITLRKILKLSVKELLSTLTHFKNNDGEDYKILMRKDGSEVGGAGTIHPFTFNGEPYLAITNFEFKEL